MPNAVTKWPQLALVQCIG